MATVQDLTTALTSTDTAIVGLKAALASGAVPDELVAQAQAQAAEITAITAGIAPVGTPVILQDTQATFTPQ